MAHMGVADTPAVIVTTWEACATCGGRGWLGEQAPLPGFTGDTPGPRVICPDCAGIGKHLVKRAVEGNSR